MDSESMARYREEYKNTGSTKSNTAVSSKGTNVWIKKSEALPDRNQRVLTHSPCYSGKDQTMEYRMMGGEFVKLAIDVKSWMIPMCNQVK